MAILVVGSVALDSLDTPAGRIDQTVGGSAVHFAAASSLFGPTQVVGVVGTDYPMAELDFLGARGVDLSGVETKGGESFRWVGRYSRDLSSRETLDTRLGVFKDFHPRIPPAFRSPEILFLGNIDPRLQLEVLEDVGEPGLVACDTMNYWIEGCRDDLMQLLGRVDIFFANDAEIRQLAGEPNLVPATRWVQAHGPSKVVVKKGEHGAVLFQGEEVFVVPGYPLETLTDPTGSGDSFAGGFLGYLHDVDDRSVGNLRRASVFGSALGSFTVEDFGVKRVAGIGREDVAQRVRELRQMTQFEFH